MRDSLAIVDQFVQRKNEEGRTKKEERRRKKEERRRQKGNAIHGCFILKKTMIL